MKTTYNLYENKFGVILFLCYRNRFCTNTYSII